MLNYNLTQKKTTILIRLLLKKHSFLHMLKPYFTHHFAEISHGTALMRLLVLYHHFAEISHGTRAHALTRALHHLVNRVLGW